MRRTKPSTMRDDATCSIGPQCKSASSGGLQKATTQKIRPRKLTEGIQKEDPKPAKEILILKMMGVLGSMFFCRVLTGHDHPLRTIMTSEVLLKRNKYISSR